MTSNGSRPHPARGRNPTRTGRLVFTTRRWRWYGGAAVAEGFVRHSQLPFLHGCGGGGGFRASIHRGPVSVIPGSPRRRYVIIITIYEHRTGRNNYIRVSSNIRSKANPSAFADASPSSQSATLVRRCDVFFFCDEFGILFARQREGLYAICIVTRGYAPKLTGDYLKQKF